MYKRIHAKVFSYGSKRYNKVIHNEKLKLFYDISGKVLEIGPGTGINIQYYPSAIDYIGLEPNVALAEYLKKELDKKHFSKSQIINGDAENIPIENTSIDVVVSTLTLCTIRNPERAVQEMKRVLKPGGTFLFMEHVAAHSGTFLHKIQHSIRGIWRLIGNGCNPDRETSVLIEQAGFEKVVMNRMNLPIFPIVSPHIIGKATK